MSHVLALAGGCRSRSGRAAAALERTAEPTWPLRHHRRRPRLRRRTRRICCASSARTSRTTSSNGRSRHPEGRKAVFLGDLVDRGPDIPARAPARAGDGRVTASALCVPGNHDIKLVRALRGRDVQIDPRTCRVACTARRRRPPEFNETRPPTFLDKPHQPLRARRWQSRRCARRNAARRCKAAPPARPRLRSLRRDDRRDRRVRATGPVQLGRRSTAARQWSFTDTHPCQRRYGSMARSTSTPAASSAAA